VLQHLTTQFAFPLIDTIHVGQVHAPFRARQSQAIYGSTLLIEHHGSLGAKLSDEFVGIPNSI
jgi:hypothetical protein